MIKFSWNKNWIDKFDRETDLNEQGYPINMSLGWKNEEMPLERFMACVMKGFAVCGRLKNQHTQKLEDYGYRSRQYFHDTNFAMVDIDDIHINETLKNPVYQDLAAGYYTSASYTPENGKHRVLFVLDRVFTSGDAWEYELLVKALIRELGGDKVTCDATRIFFGSSKGSFELTGKTVGVEEIKELIEMEREEHTKVFDKISDEMSDEERTFLIDALCDDEVYFGGYLDWMSVGFAMIDLGFDVDDFITVSQCSTDSKDEKRCVSFWRNAQVKSAYGPGTLWNYTTKERRVEWAKKDGEKARKSVADEIKLALMNDRNDIF